MAAQAQSGSSSAAYPRWVMLEQYLETIKVEDDSSCSATDGDDAKTLAAARTSTTCRSIQVYLRLAEPPALSRVCLRIPEGVVEEKSQVLAAHGDSVLIRVGIKEKNQRRYITEHLVYNAGAAAADPPRPPSLWLLPPYYEHTYYSGSDPVPRELLDGNTGLLRRGDDELVVAEVTARSRSPGDGTPRMDDVYLFRSGEWNRYKFEVTEGWDLPSSWDTVVPVADRLLCWVNLSRGVMLHDVFEETPSVRYVRLPMDPHEGTRSNRNVCTTAGGGTLKFVNIFGRCCCGAAASCNCEHSRHAYTIHTWTMRIDFDGNMEWVKDGIVDATELWALDAYKGLPCDPLNRPFVSLDDPEVICFRLLGTRSNRRRTLWQILVNMRSKTIHSVSRHEEDLGYCYARDKLIPSQVSYFFNTFTGQNHVDDARPPAAVAVDEQLIIGDADSGNPMLQPSSVAELASVQALLEMFDALQEIPSYGLPGPDEVKAYRILSSDNGRRIRSLLRLPKDMRKDWLLMEIKAADAN